MYIVYYTYVVAYNMVQLYVCMYVTTYVTISRLRSKETMMIDKSCIPHSKNTTECTLVYINGKVLHIKQAQHFDSSYKSLIEVYDCYLALLYSSRA